MFRVGEQNIQPAKFTDTALNMLHAYVLPCAHDFTMWNELRLFL